MVVTVAEAPVPEAEALVEVAGQQQSPNLVEELQRQLEVANQELQRQQEAANQEVLLLRLRLDELEVIGCRCRCRCGAVPVPVPVRCGAVR